jgi:hypothetical protein
MAAGRGWGGASRAGSNRPALACARAAPPCPRRGILSPTYVAVSGFRGWLLTWRIRVPFVSRIPRVYGANLQAYSNDEWDATRTPRTTPSDARRLTDRLRAADRLEGSRPAGFHPGGLGWRVRAHARVGAWSGRDHNPEGFLVWMAGGGIKGGCSYGSTDEIVYKAVKNPVSVHDLHVAILHLLGLDHKQLTFLHNGRRFRLTDVAGRVIPEISWCNQTSVI